MTELYICAQFICNLDNGGKFLAKVVTINQIVKINLHNGAISSKIQ